MSTLTKESLAAMLNGREMGEEMTEAEEREAQAAGLVVAFGASDDLIEFRGAISDEGDCYGGGDVFVTEDGVLEGHNDCECDYCGYDAIKSKAEMIEAIWGERGCDYSWTYKTDLPHATFDVLERGEKYCRGIIFSISDL